MGFNLLALLFERGKPETDWVFDGGGSTDEGAKGYINGKIAPFGYSRKLTR